MSSAREAIPRSTLVAAGLGGLGYTLPFFLIALYWVSFYTPPEHAGVPLRIDPAPLLGVSLLSLIIFGTRAWDILVDPWIANRSDGLVHPDGRRIPFMRRSFLIGPLAVAAIFWTPVAGISGWNALWVLVAMLVAVTALSAYTTPFLALLTSMASSEEDRISLATAQGVGESMGIVVAGQAAFLWGVLEGQGQAPMEARQWTFLGLAILSTLLLVVPIVLLRGKEPPAAEQSEELRFADRVQLIRSSPGFALFLLAFFCFIMSVELVQAGAYYFVSVLLELPEERLSLLMALMVPSSLIAVPTTNALAQRFSKPPLILANFLLLGLLLIAGSQLGRFPVSADVQSVVFFVVGGIPLGSMTVLVMAVVMDCAQEAEQQAEAVFVAARNLAYKSGLTLGAALFASFTVLGRDRGDDLGIRMACWAGAALCALAVVLGYPAMRKMRQGRGSQQS